MIDAIICTLLIGLARLAERAFTPALGSLTRPQGRRRVLIVGAGPVGVYAAYYAGFRSQSVAVMDSLPEIGGQVSAMYPEKLIYDVAGLPAVRGRDLIAALAEQAGRYGPKYLLGKEARFLEYPGGTPVVTTSSGLRVRAQFIVVTGGIGTFTPRRLEALAGFEGRGLAYFVPRPDEYRGRDVVIVGGGDSAFDWALSLSPVSRSVRVIHRRDTFRAHESLVRQVLDRAVPIITNAEIAGARGDGWIAVQLPYLGGDGYGRTGLAMTIVVPDDLADFAATLDAARIAEISWSGESADVPSSRPRTERTCGEIGTDLALRGYTPPPALIRKSSAFRVREKPSGVTMAGRGNPVREVFNVSPDLWLLVDCDPGRGSSERQTFRRRGAAHARDR